MRAGPGLLRADARPEFRAADAAAGEIAADIGHPDHQQHEHQRRKALAGSSRSSIEAISAAAA